MVLIYKDLKVWNKPRLFIKIEKVKHLRVYSCFGAEHLIKTDVCRLSLVCVEVSGVHWHCFEALVGRYGGSAPLPYRPLS